MDDQSAAAQRQAEPDSAPPPPQIAEPINTQTTQPATAQQLADVEEKMSGFEKATLRWAKIAVLMSALAAAFVCAQWYEMHSGATDTHTLAQAAKTQAEKMQTMSDAADKIKEAAQNMVIQDQRIADNAQKSLDASNKQSKAVFGQTIAVSRIDQRAWVGIVDVHIVQFDETKPLRVSVDYFNTGKTPPTNVRQSMMYRITRDPIEGPYPEDSRSLVFGLKPANTVAPQGRYTLTFPVLPDSTNPLGREYAVLKSKMAFVYFFGEMQYDDISGITHTTTFCTFMSDPDARAMSFCPRFNEMN